MAIGNSPKKIKKGELQTAQSVRDLNAELGKTLDHYDEQIKGEREINEFIADRTKALDDQLKIKREITKGEQDLAKVLQKGTTQSLTQARIYKQWLQLKAKIFGYDNKTAQAAQANLIDSIKTLNAWQRMLRVKKQIGEVDKKLSKHAEGVGLDKSLSKADGLIGGIGAALLKFIRNPLLLIGASVGMTLSMYERYSEVIDKTGQIFGAQVGMSTDLRDAVMQVNAEGAALNINIESIAGMLPDVADKFGKSSIESVKLAAKMKDTAMATGLADSEATSLYDSLLNVMNLSEESATNLAKGVYELSMQNKVAPQAVMKDIANNSGLIADYGKDGAVNIAKAAINAKKFGLNLATVEKIANGLLNFEDSIAKEMEASVMIGRNLNFNMARRLALEGDIDGAVQNVIAQLGGQEEFAKMDVLQKRALADAIGISTTELAKYMNKQNEVTVEAGKTKEEIEGMGKLNVVSAEKSKSDLKLMQDYMKNIKDVGIPGMTAQFEKMDGVVKGIHGTLEKIMNMFGAFNIIKSLFGIGLIWMIGRSKLFRSLMMGIFSKFGKGSGPSKAWNNFQKSMKGKGLSPKEMSKAYKKTPAGQGKKGGIFGKIGGFFSNTMKTAKAGMTKLKPKKGWFSGLAAAGGGLWKGIKGIGKKVSGKVLGKGMLKSVLKKIPGVGLLAGLGFGAHRLLQGDWQGALGEVASGAASLIPGIGTLASGVIDAGLMGRDMGMMGDGMSIGGGPGAIVRGQGASAKIVKFSGADDLMAFNAQRLAQLGGGTGPFGGGSGLSAEELGGAVYSGVMAANASKTTVVTRDQILELTQPSGYQNNVGER